MSPPAPSVFEVLEDALSDVGIWRWWTERLPDAFQLEFLGAQLRRQLTAAAGPTEPVAVRFDKPSVVAFLSRDPALPPDWPELLARDACPEQLWLSPEDMAINSPEAISDLFTDTMAVRMHLGSLPADLTPYPATMAFWARGAGILICAEAIDLAADRRYPIEETLAWNTRWWDYWRVYWNLRGTAEALATDWVCEACIPTK